MTKVLLDDEAAEAGEVSEDGDGDGAGARLDEEEEGATGPKMDPWDGVDGGANDVTMETTGRRATRPSALEG